MITTSHGIRLISAALAEAKMVRADDDVTILLERIGQSIISQPVGDFCVQYEGRQIEFLFELLLPLLSEHGRYNDQYATAAFRPPLGKHDTSLNGFSKTNLISKNDTVG